MSERPGPGVLAVVAVGGALGSLGRYAVGLGLPHRAGEFPWGTMVVNLSGAFAIGLLVAYLMDRPGSHPLARPFLGVGVLGGWTTYSAFAVDLLQLADAGRITALLAYAVGALLLGTLAVGAGTAAGRALWPGP